MKIVYDDACSLATAIKKPGAARSCEKVDVTAVSTCDSVSFSPVMFVTPFPFCTNSNIGVAWIQPCTRTISLMSYR